MSIVYRSFSKDYETEVLRLLNICFPLNQITKESFEWKHLDKFFQGRQKAMIALDADKVCAFVCFNPLVVVNKDNRLEYYSCSVQATHPDYRRRGIITELTKAIEKELGPDTNYFGFSNESGVKIDFHSKTIGYKVLGQMRTRYILPSPLKNRYRIHKVKGVTSKVNLSINDNLFFLERSNQYFDWRFIRNPKVKFEYYEIYKKEKFIGVVVMKKSKYKYEIIKILPLRLDFLKDIINAVSHIAYKKKVALISFSYLPNHVWKSVFPALSISRKIEMYFTVKSLDENTQKVDNWLIQGGDIQ